MPVLKKRAPNHQVNGLYVHSNPPRVLNLTPANLKQLIRNGDLEKLEQVVLEGQGKKLVGEYSPDYKVRVFLKSIPALISKLSLIHDAVNSGRLEELQALLDEEPNNKKKYALSKDEAGVGLLHKAVYYDLRDIAKYLAHNFPGSVQMRDSEGRTPYLYTVACRDVTGMQKMLLAAGADPSVVDNKQNTIKYYTDHPQELELPSTHKITSKSTTRRLSRKDCIGYYTSLKLASRGCKVIIACRSNAEDAKRNIIGYSGNKNIITKYLDLGSLSSIRKFADEINQTEERLDILINNAGICHSEKTYTKDGLITVHQVNHYGPFLLTHLLMGLLKKSSPSRIIFVSSLLSFNHSAKSKILTTTASMLCYNNTKLLNIIVSKMFAEKLKGTDVTCNCVHPGTVDTEINKPFGYMLKVKIFNACFFFFKKSPEEGAETQFHVAISKKLRQVSGKFFMNCMPMVSPSLVNDKEFCRHVWDHSEKIVELKEGEKL